MPEAAWIGAIVTLGVFVIGHLMTTIWWASRVNTLLDVVQNKLSEIVVNLKAMESSYVKKEELAYRVATSDKEHAAMWKQIDDLKASQ